MYRLAFILLCTATSLAQAQTLVVADDHYGIPFGQQLQVEPLGVLENDTLDGESAGENGAIAKLVTGPAFGLLQCPSDSQLALCPDGSFDYTPGEGFPGSDSFVYMAEADAVTDTATVALSACDGGPDVFSCWHESAYLSLLAELGYASFWESFEGSAWDIARSPEAAPAVTSQGITWTSNYPATNPITTGNGPARTGLYGVYDPQHGFATGSSEQCDVDMPAESCLFHDGFRGSRLAGEGNLHGAGGYITGTSGANLSIILDDTIEIGFGDLPGNQHQFIGVVDDSPGGFRSYEFREMDGKVGQEFYVWGDDFTLAIVPPPTNTTPVADAGSPQAVMVGDTVVLDGSGSNDVDEDTLTYRWSFESLPVDSFTELDTTDPVHPGFVTDEAGTYVVRLIVNDSTVDSAPDTVEITAGCRGAVISISNTTIPFGVTECIATTSITVGPNVLVEPGAELWLLAPALSLTESVTVALGATLYMGPIP